MEVEGSGLDSTRDVTIGVETDGRRLVIPSLVLSSSTAAFGDAASRASVEAERDGPNPPRLLDEDVSVVRGGGALLADEEDEEGDWGGLKRDRKSVV